MNLKRHWILLFAFIFLNLSFQISLLRAETARHLHLLITSDLHGWLSTSGLYPTQRRKGLLHLKDRILLLKAKHKNHVLIDAGDLLQGSPLSFYHHHVRDFTGIENPFFNLVNSLGYDAVVVGNHDLGVNPLLENKYLPHSKFAWLAANIYREGKPVFKPYLRLQRAGLKVVIAGFTTPGVLIWQSSDQLYQMEVRNLLQSVDFWLAHIKKREKPDLLIGVFHVGLNAFRDDENSKLSRIPAANNLRQVIEMFSDFDLIVSGHDHHLNPRKSGRPARYIMGTPVISGGRWGEAVLDAELRLTKSRMGWSISDLEVRVFWADQEDEIDDIYVRQTGSKFRSYMEEKLPWMLTPVSNKEASECINTLIAISQESEELDATFFPLVRINNMNKYVGRNIRRSDLFRWVKYDNSPVIVKMNQRQLFLLKNPISVYGYKRVSYNRKLYFRQKNDLLSFGESSYFLNKGLFGRHYQVAISDYHFRGGGGIVPPLFLNTDDVLSISTDFLRDAVFRVLQDRESLPAACKFMKYNPLKPLK
jgi:2',3'-cyclic-nucleotide 2'-phosphodiesterase (5'-nucleotidase family)